MLDIRSGKVWQIVLQSKETESAFTQDTNIWDKREFDIFTKKATST